MATCNALCISDSLTLKDAFEEEINEEGNLIWDFFLGIFFFPPLLVASVAPGGSWWLLVASAAPCGSWWLLRLLVAPGGFYGSGS